MDGMENKIIDVDKFIEIYNKKNPQLKQLNRKDLAKILECNTQVFSDWKGGRLPKLGQRLLTMSVLADCNIKDFIIDKKDGKTQD